MYAARQDAQDAAKALADSGADLNAGDADGATALQLAIINEHYDMAALLLDKGADPNKADLNGMTGLYAAVDMLDFRSDIGRARRKSMDKLTALDIVKLSLKHGGNPNAQLKKPIIGRHHGFGDNSLGDGATVLMRAVKSNDFDVMRLLLDAGANPALGMTNGSNPVLVLAALRGNTDKVTAMLRTFAEKGANLNAANKRGGDTALHIAVKASNNPLVRALLELGADLSVKDSNGKTPLDVAKEETAAILKGFTAAVPASK
jgi:serine/threonine-protein phosphatase 6 regulatory ankyrin repeat subunit B